LKLSNKKKNKLKKKFGVCCHHYSNARRLPSLQQRSLPTIVAAMFAARHRYNSIRHPPSLQRRELQRHVVVRHRCVELTAIL